MPEVNQMEIVHCLSTLECVASSVIRELDEAFQKDFRASGVVSGNKLGGVEIIMKREKSSRKLLPFVRKLNKTGSLLLVVVRIP